MQVFLFWIQWLPRRWPNYYTELLPCLAPRSSLGAQRGAPDREEETKHIIHGCEPPWRDSHLAAAADGENAPPGGDMEGPGMGLSVHTTQLCVFLSEYAPSTAEGTARQFVPVGEVQDGPAGAGMRLLLLWES